MTPNILEPRPEIKAIIERLKRGDLSALELVSSENVIAVLDRTGGDKELGRLLEQKL